jgi:precorrin-6Y C5,15-methyltransferase (decarboxylating)
MAETPWLSIIGLGEDGLNGLSPTSRAALDAADVVMGPPRHLSLLPDLQAETIAWPVPFSEGITHLLGLRGRKVAVLASGDPFWFGAGSVLARQLNASEWQAFPGASCFSMAAAQMGWPLEKTNCLGLHAAPLTRLRPLLASGIKVIATLRDGAAVSELAQFLITTGFGESQITTFEALGGPREAKQSFAAHALPKDAEFAHPICVALDLKGAQAIPLAAGRPDDTFASDGQITKRPVRALTLSALAPRPFEHLWDIGGGSGSIGIEWLWAHPTLTATTIEPRADRAERIAQNALDLGVDRLKVVTGKAPDALTGLQTPDVVFIGGGLSLALLDWLWDNLPTGTRLVANAVTLESEALLITQHAARGGDLLRAEISQAGALGPRRGWKAAYPIVQWSVTL